MIESEGKMWGRGVPFPVAVFALCGLKGGLQRAGTDGGMVDTEGRKVFTQPGLSYVYIFPAGFLQLEPACKPTLNQCEESSWHEVPKIRCQG